MLTHVPTVSTRPSATSVTTHVGLAHLAPAYIIAATANSTIASSMRSHSPFDAGGSPHAQTRADLHADDGRGGIRRHERPVTVVDDRAGGGGDADHEGARRGGRTHRYTAPRVQHGHFDESAAHSQQGRHVAGDERCGEGERHPLEPVGHDASEPLVVILPAERARVSVVADKEIRVPQPPEHHDGRRAPRPRRTACAAWTAPASAR